MEFFTKKEEFNLKQTDELSEKKTSFEQDCEKGRKIEKNKELIDRFTYEEEKRKSQLKTLEKILEKDLSQLEPMRLKAENLRGNIEYLLGSVEIPVGLVGPLKVHNTKDDHYKNVFLPIATTEGALVSSVQKGVKVCNLSGGIRSYVIKNRMTRAPVFDCGSLQNALQFKSWIEDKKPILKKRAESYSQHARLVDIECRLILPAVHVQFMYETGDASGQNMTTFCTWNLCTWIQSQLEQKSWVKSFMIEGNLSSDKKQAPISSILGRGREVVAECLIPHEMLKNAFGLKIKDIIHASLQSRSSSILTGLSGYNINVANLISGCFVATGQDIASVHESSTAQMHTEERKEGLYISLLMPNLVVATVGGGVSLPIQKQLLELMECYGKYKADDLARAVCSFSLALELVTACSIIKGHFAQSHEKLGRNRPNGKQKEISIKTLDSQFFQNFFKETICSISDLKAPLNTSITMGLSYKMSRSLVGFRAYDLNFQNKTKKKVFIKSRLSDEEQMEVFARGACFVHEQLPHILLEHKDHHIYKHCHKRELSLAQTKISSLKKVMPHTFGVINDPHNNNYILIQEYLDPENIEMFEAIEQRQSWTEEPINCVIEQASFFHSHFIKYPKDLEDMDYLLYLDENSVQKTAPIYLTFAQFSKKQGWLSEEDVQFHKKAFESLPYEWSSLKDMPQTLTHNDFNPRNLCFKKKNPLKLVIYDWELASKHIPQRDLAEFFSFTFPLDFKEKDLIFWIEEHRKKIEKQTGRSLSSSLWVKGYRLALLDFILHRLPIYSLAGVYYKLPFLKPSYKVARRMLEILSS